MLSVRLEDVAPPDVVAKTAPGELDVRLTESGVVVGLPNASCSCTVMPVVPPRVALDDANPVTAVEVKTSFAAGAGLTVTVFGAAKVWVGEMLASDADS